MAEADILAAQSSQCLMPCSLCLGTQPWVVIASRPVITVSYLLIFILPGPEYGSQIHHVIEPGYRKPKLKGKYSMWRVHPDKSVTWALNLCLMKMS